MKKVRIKEKTFKVIPEAKIVQGKMPIKWYQKDMARGYKPLHKRLMMFGMDMLYPLISDWSGDFFVHANAYCDEKDTFDEKTGVEVCAAKLEMKNHMKLAKAYAKLYVLMSDTMRDLAELCYEHSQKAAAIEHDLVKTYGRMEV